MHPVELLGLENMLVIVTKQVVFAMVFSISTSNNEPSGLLFVLFSVCFQP